MQVIYFEIHSHDSCPGLSSPHCSPPSPEHPPDFIPYSVSLLHRSPFWLSIIKEGILTGSYKKMAATFGGKGAESVMGWRGVASHSAQHASSLTVWNAAQGWSGTEPNMLVSALNWDLSMSLKKQNNAHILKRRNMTGLVPQNYSGIL